MKASIAIELAQQKKLTEPQNMVFEGLNLSIAQPQELASLIAQGAKKHGEQNIPEGIDRYQLVNIAKEFHSKAGTLTKEVSHGLESLLRGEPILRFAHQPIHLPYMGVMAQFILLNEVAQNLKPWNVSTCQIYRVVDYDVSAEKRLRVSHYPRIDSRNGFVSFSLPKPHKSLEMLNLNMRKPKEIELMQWFSVFDATIVQNIADLRSSGIKETQLGRIYESVRHIKNELEEARNRADNLPEFNSIFLSRIVNLHWRLPTLFIPSFQTIPLQKKHFEYLLKQYPNLVEATNKVVNNFQQANISIPKSLKIARATMPFWYICPNCLVRMSLTSTSLHRLKVTGICSQCHELYQFDLGTFSKPNLNAVYKNITPKVLFEDLMDTVAFQAIGGVGYMGNAEHAMVSRAVSRSLELNLFPEILWRPNGIYWGGAECKALLQIARQSPSKKIDAALKMILSSRANGLYYLSSQGIEGLLEMWQKHFIEGNYTYQLNEGEPAFQIGDEKRQFYREKITHIG